MNDLDEEDTAEVSEDDADEEELGEDEAIDADSIELGDAELDEDDGELMAVEEALSQKEQNAKSLAIRRAIEQRMDKKRLDEDLDYLDLDMED